MKVFTKEDFTGKSSATVEAVPIGQEGTAYIRVMSGARREAYLEAVRLLPSRSADEEAVSATAHLIAATLCDEDGNLYYPRYPKDVTSEDLVAIGERPWFWLDPLVDRAGFLNGFSAAGKAAAGNGSPAKTSSSSTVSPAISEKPEANSTVQ